MKKLARTVIVGEANIVSQQIPQAVCGVYIYLKAVSKLDALNF